MPITPDPSSPVGTSIPLQKADIDRLLKGSPANAVASKAYGLDPGFRKAYDHYANSEIDDNTRQRLPELVLNRYYYGSWERQTANDLTATMSQQKGFVNKIVEDTKQRSVNFGQSLERFQQGEQGIASTALQLAGEATGLAFGDVPARILEGGFNLLPEGARQSISDSAQSFLGTPLGQAGLQALESGMETYDTWKKENEVAAENLESVLNIGSSLPVGQIGKMGLQTGVKGTQYLSRAGKLAPRLGEGVVEQAKPLLRKLNARFANVPDQVLERAYLFPDQMERAMDVVAKNPDNPYLNLARDASVKLMKYDTEAGQQFQIAKKAFKEANPDARFDISQSVPDMQTILKDKFNVGLKVDEVGDSIVVKVEPGPANKLTTKEVRSLEDLVNTLANAKSFTTDDLLDMPQAFDKAYDAVRLTETKQPKPYHAMIMALKSRFDEVMRGGGNVPGILPDEMKSAYAQLASAKQLLKEFGGNLLQGEGNARRMSDNAESFIKSLANINRGQRRRRILNLENALGLDIADTVDFLDDVKALSKLAAETSGRPGDIVKALILPAIGSVLGTAVAPGTGLGTVAGLAAGEALRNTVSSPIKAAKRQIKAGRKAIQKAKPTP